MIMDQVATSFSSEKGLTNKYIPTVKMAVPHSWYTSNGTFKTNKVSEINPSFVNILLASQFI